MSGSRSSTGGISKRSSDKGKGRIDRDGDLDMDAPANRGRGRGARRGGSGARPININNAPKGPAADRERHGGSGSGATRSRGSPRNPPGTRSVRSTTAPRRAPASSGPTVGVKVYGWKQSKGSAEECVRFIERKANIRIKKTQKQGDYLILYVPTSELQSVLDWDKAKFAGVNLKITSDVVADLFNTAMEDATPQNSNTVETIKVLEEVLRLRYNPETKLLDLSKLGDDLVLQKNGFFNFSSTTSKMFPALMAVADKKFDTAQQKRDAIQSVSLAGNNLTSIAAVTTLSITFPDLKNLSLESNLIEDLKGLEGWKSRFRRLEQLVLTGNPVTSDPNYREEMIRRYPKLVMLDNVEVVRPQIGDTKRSEPLEQKPSTAVDANGRPILPLPVKGNLLVDHNGLAMAFLSDFFTQIDNDKDSILAKFYTPESKFSMAVNTSAPRVEALHNERQWWDLYIPKSRNLKRIRQSDDGKIFDMMAQGPNEIRDLWKSLPATLHNLGNQELWSFDIIPVEISPGVSALLASVHSEFEEANSSIGGVVKRSFDRHFTLWIDPVTQSVKVMSEMLTVRSYAGATAWKPEPEREDPEAAEKRQKIQMLADKTGLNLKYAEMCLADTNWDLAAAWNAFAWAKDNGQLGPEAWATAPPV